jgi:hypothetical protein
MVLASLALLGMCVPVARAESMIVTQCGETVAPGRTAYLVADLDCRGSGVAGVVLSHRSRLVMSGHAIIGDAREADADGAPIQGVRCTTGSVCTVEGPGTITGFSASGVAGTRVRLRDVWIGGNGIAGVSAYEDVQLRNVVFSDNGMLAVNAGGRVRASDADLGTDPSAVLEWGAPPFKPRHRSGS